LIKEIVKRKLGWKKEVPWEAKQGEQARGERSQLLVLSSY
jgi:hypothetical protein